VLSSLHTPTTTSGCSHPAASIAFPASVNPGIAKCMCPPLYCTVCAHTCHPLEKIYAIILIRWQWLVGEACFFCPWRRFYIGSRVGQQDQAHLSLWAPTKIEVISCTGCTSPSRGNTASADSFQIELISAAIDGGVSGSTVLASAMPHLNLT
jgi:hypothetical protein